jgi:hypothetical protein
MRLQNRVILGAAFLSAVISAALVLSTSFSGRPATPVPTSEGVFGIEPREPVGWVFGRVMGVPGADRPLMSASGSLGGRPIRRLPATRVD